MLLGVFLLPRAPTRTACILFALVALLFLCSEFQRLGDSTLSYIEKSNNMKFELMVCVYRSCLKILCIFCRRNALPMWMNFVVGMGHESGLLSYVQQLGPGTSAALH